MKDTKLGIVSRKAALILNMLIVSAYVAIALLAVSPWMMFGGFLLLAVVIRCATLCWMTFSLRANAEGSAKASLSLVLRNLIFALLFSAVLLGGLWWLGRFWLTGIKVIVPCIAVYVAYKSTFPVLSRRSTVNDIEESSNNAM